ncbi:MAG: copper transporter [Aeromicrobium sp.]
MINFRYHLVSIAAIFLALAAGVALGSGPLDDAKNIVGDNGKDNVNASAVVAQKSDLAGFESAYAKQTGSPLVAGKLKGQSIVVFTLPGTRSDQVRDLKSTVTSGGAKVTGEVALNPKLLDSASRQFAEGVTQQASKGVKGVATSGDSYLRIGSALGRAFLAKETTQVDGPASTIVAAFVEGDLISLTSKPAELATIALVVAGPGSADQGQGDIMAQMAVGFDTQARGVLLAGPSASSKDGGFVQVLSSSDAARRVSTIDVIDSAAGRWVAVLVAAREIDDKAGSYGTSRSADGAIPK